jgi:hypothetical protein
MSDQKDFQKEKWLMQIDAWDKNEPFPKMATIRFFGSEILSSLESAKKNLEESGCKCEIIYDVKEPESALAQLTVKKRGATDYIKFETSDFVEINIVYSGKGMRQSHAVFSMKRFVEDSEYSFVEDYVRKFLDVLSSS